MMFSINIYNAKNNSNINKYNQLTKLYLSSISHSKFISISTAAILTYTNLFSGGFYAPANAAEWGQSGKGGEGGYAWTNQTQGASGESSKEGAGGNGGEGGATSGTDFKIGHGGSIGSNNTDQIGAIQGGNGSAANATGSCTPGSSAPCGVGGAGGGGGGAGLVLDDKASISHGNIHGGNGGDGGMNFGLPSGAGEGGNGGAGLYQNGATYQNNNELSGGTGGTGGVGGTNSRAEEPAFNPQDCKAGKTCYTGSGGDGGAGADIRNGAQLTNNNIITGGKGGTGGGIFNDGPNYKLGDGGNGGNGVDLSGGSTLINNGAITGGNAGTNPNQSNQPGSLPGRDGTDGFGIYAKGNNNTVINQKNGVISAGGEKPESGIAIRFYGDDNTLERQSGSTIIGNAVAIGKNNGLSLGGDEDQDFDVSEFGARYKGFERLQKDGNATATVTGVGTYTGETVINGGMLKLSSNSSLESSSAIKNNAKFDITAIAGNGTSIKALTGEKADAVAYLGGKEIAITNGTGSYAGSIDGDNRSRLSITGGHTILKGDNSGYEGNTSIKSGAELTIDHDLGGTTLVETNGLLSGAGSVQNLVNSGTLIIGSDTGFTNKTIRGDYIGKDGTIIFNSKLGDDTSPTDHLDILGNTSGNSNVKINNRDGIGAQTDKGIDLISVGGNADGSFNLIGDYQLDGQNVVEAGAYAYILKKGGNGGNGKDYYLTSQLKEPKPVEPCEITGTCPPAPSPDVVNYAASIPLVSAYTRAFRSFNKATTLQERIGNRYWTDMSANLIPQGDGPALESIALPNPDDNSILTDYGLFWSKISGRHDRYEPDDSSIDYRSTVNTWTFTAGADNQLYETDSGRLIGGVWFEYGLIDSRVTSPDRDGKIKAKGYGGGASLTWYGDNGLYVDGLGKFDWYRNDINSDKSGGIRIVDDAKGFGYALSIETGKRFKLDEYWSWTPQAQLSWSSLDLYNFRNIFGATNRFERQNDLTARLGVTANYAYAWQGSDGFTQRTSFYAGANLYQGLIKDNSDVRISAAGRPNERSALIDPGNLGQTWVGIGAGGTYSWQDDKYSIFGNVNTASSVKDFGKNYSVSGNLGLTVKW